MDRARASVGDTIRSMARELESELSRAVAYINDQVVPEVRRSSSLRLRAAAEQLERMAEQLDRGPRSRAGASAQQSASR